MNEHGVLILQPFGESKTAQHIAQCFRSKVITNADDCLALAAGDEFKVLVIDLLACDKIDLRQYKSFLVEEAVEQLPVILLSPSKELRHKLAAFELGFDDIIDNTVPQEEASARISKSIFNQIANQQLKSRLRQANETAFSAMSDNSDLGSNLQFLVEENRCDNLDELGQLLFATIDRYDLSCSLQMRSIYGTKNMEANGMAKDLESQLLEQLYNSGRFVDFGRRTIINYGQASLLIRNMPVGDPKRYGSIKDNFLALLQGLDARIKALDSRNKLIDEKNALHKLSSDVREVMIEIDNSYQKVMRDIASVVEDMAEAIQARIPTLALSEEQEQFFEAAVTNCVVDTNRVFNEGLKVDQCFMSLREGMDKALCDFAHIEQEMNLAHNPPPPPPRGGNAGVELF